VTTKEKKGGEGEEHGNVPTASMRPTVATRQVLDENVASGNLGLPAVGKRGEEKEKEERKTK